MKTLTPILCSMILLLNIPLLFGGPSADLLFQPEAFAQGDWWRLITHPFIHVSLYHLLLDAGAFLFLWWSRPGPHQFQSDITLLSCCACGSLLGALWSGIPSGGFGGLSGAAHGLMAYQGMAWLLQSNDPPSNKIMGAMLVLIVVGKACLETITETVFLNTLHFGTIGLPITACHLGGALGGLFFAWGQPLKYKLSYA
jgi:rhomboid family GlyGly-CTERM serine protease